jgi:uncharacterized membrane protein
MTNAGHLWAVGYDDVGRAEQIRDEVLKLRDKHCLILLDTAVAVRYPDGCVTLNGEPFVSVPYFQAHGFASFLAGLALRAPPLTGPAAGALVRACGGAAAEVGIDEDFVNEVRALMKPGTSALFVLDQEGDMDEILQGIRGLGGIVIRTNVDVTRARLIQSALAAADNRPEDRS